MGDNVSIGFFTRLGRQETAITTVNGAVISRLKIDPVGTATGATNDQAVGESSSGDDKTTAAVDGNEGPADANNDITE